MTPQAFVAAYFQIPWSRLTTRGYDDHCWVDDVGKGDHYRLPFLEIRLDFEVHEILRLDRNHARTGTYWLSSQDIQDAIFQNGSFVTEMDKPEPNFLIGPL